MAELGQAATGQQQVSAYYYARAVKACQAKDAAAAKAIYPKIKSAQLRQPAEQVCKAFGIELP